MNRLKYLKYLVIALLFSALVSGAFSFAWGEEDPPDTKYYREEEKGEIKKQ